MPEEIPVRTLRNEVAQVIRRVEEGESFEITRHGRRVARIVPATRERRAATLADFWAFRERVPADPSFARDVRSMRIDRARDPFDRWDES